LWIGVSPKFPSYSDFSAVVVIYTKGGITAV